jgi:hypothetical protein
MKQSTLVVSGRVEVNSAAGCPHALSHSLPLATTARQVAVVQQRRPASACRSLLSLRHSDSSAYTRAVLSREPHSFAARVYRLVRPHSFTHNPHTRSSQADRPYHPSPPHSHEQIHARQQSPPRSLSAHCPLPILGYDSPPSFVPYRKPLLLPTKPARPPPGCHSVFLTSPTPQTTRPSLFWTFTCDNPWTSGSLGYTDFSTGS